MPFCPPSLRLALYPLSHELLGQTFGEFGVFLRFSAADADAADAAPGFVEYGHASGQRGEARIAEVRDGEVFPDEAIVERLRGQFHAHGGVCLALGDGSGALGGAVQAEEGGELARAVDDGDADGGASGCFGFEPTSTSITARNGMALFMERFLG